LGKKILEFSGFWLFSVVRLEYARRKKIKDADVRGRAVGERRERRGGARTAWAVCWAGLQVGLGRGGAGLRPRERDEGVGRPSASSKEGIFLLFYSFSKAFFKKRFEFN